MPLSTSSPIGFIPTQNPEAAREFYEQILGLRFVTDNDFAIVFHVGPEPGMMLRIVRAPSFTPATYTAFGWIVDDLRQTVDDLTAKGISFSRHPYFQQDDYGIWNAPDGTSVAWFQDPDGNTLSVSQQHQP